MQLRVVSLSPAASELMLALGAGGQLVAVDAESRDDPELGHLPAVDLATTSRLAPDVALVPALTGADVHSVAELRTLGIDVVEVAPHDFDDLFELCRELRVRLGLVGVADAFLGAMSRGLADIAASSFGERRPRVAAVLRLAPLEIAGGHSFTTDLIEIAGAESVTHGSEEWRVSMSEEQLASLSPDLVVYVSRTELSDPEKQAVRRAFPWAPRLVFFAFDPERFWARNAVEAASRLRELIGPPSSRSRAG